MECSICFCEEKCLLCECNTPYCNECIDGFVENCMEESIIPACVSCHKPFEPTGNKRAFFTCYFREMMSNTSDLERHNSMQRMSEKLRNQKLDFAKKEFPPAIALVTELCFKSKLKTIKKKSDVKIKFGKSCFECDGFMNSELKCMECKKQFCKFCEKECVPGHMCDENDVKSVEEMKNYIRCPKCEVVIFKHSGCDHMTCANCSTKFVIGSNIEGHGGGGHSEILETERVLKQDKLSNMYWSEEVLEVEKIIFNPPNFERRKLTLMNSTGSEHSIGYKYYKLRCLKMQFEKMESKYYESIKLVKEGKESLI